MEEKTVTYYLDPTANDRLQEDMSLFHIDLNESTFIKKLIINYFPEYNKKQNVLKDKIKELISYHLDENITDDKGTDIAWNITKYLDDLTIASESKTLGNKRKVKKHIRKNKNDDQLLFILESCPKDATLSEFIANIIYSYLDKPQHEREKIIFKDIVETIEKAIAKNQRIKILSKSNSRNEYKTSTVDPKELDVSREELYNYLLCKGYDDQNQIEYANSIHLYNIKSVHLLPERSYFSDDINNKFDRMKRNGIQFSIRDNITYKVKLTDFGRKLYDLRYLERPAKLDCSDETTGIYYFDCSEMQFTNYFAPFYDEVMVLEPKSYLESFINKLNQVTNIYEVTKA